MALLYILPMIVSFVVVLFFRFINKTYNPPIFGIYRQKNKYFWCKFVFMYAYLRFRQLAAHIKWILAVELGHSHYDGTVHIQDNEIALEQMHPLDTPLAVDAVYFNGLSKDGSAVICGIAKRKDHCDAFLLVKINGEDLYLTPTWPDTYLQQAEGEEGHSVAGISANHFIPMRTWNVSYRGEMKSRQANKLIKVETDLTWSATWPAFNFDLHMSPRSMAFDMAREPWSADYFKLLKTYHQTHYEQMGQLAGSVFLDGKEHKINMPCVRDHTVGKHREWRNFHRYVLHYFFLENGDCMEIGVVSQPVVMSHITIGYLCCKSDQRVFPVKGCDFHLWQHGENQILPRDYGFTFEAGGEFHSVKLTVKDEDSFYIGKMRESRFYERWCAVEVNGIKGWGCVEWQYNNVPALNNK